MSDPSILSKTAVSSQVAPVYIQVGEDVRQRLKDVTAKAGLTYSEFINRACELAEAELADRNRQKEIRQLEAYNKELQRIVRELIAAEAHGDIVDLLIQTRIRIVAEIGNLKREF